MMTNVIENATDLGGLVDRLSTALSDPVGVDASSIDLKPKSVDSRSGTGRAGQRYVGVRIEGEAFAVPMASVVEIQRLPPLTALPGVADWLLGVTNFHGDVLSVVDPRSILGLPETSKSEKRMMVLQSADRSLQTGIVVDATLGVRLIDETDVRPPEGELSSKLARYLRAMCVIDDRLMSILNVEQLLEDLLRAVDENG